MLMQRLPDDVFSSISPDFTFFLNNVVDLRPLRGHCVFLSSYSPTRYPMSHIEPIHTTGIRQRFFLQRLWAHFGHESG